MTARSIWLAVALISISITADAAERPPNIVFFLVDDMGWVDPACYGNRFHETPNIDRFAKEGLLFTDAYAACPVCSPTRASILTGKYPATLNLTDFIPGHWRPYEQLIVPEMNLHLPLEEVTIAEALKPAGYKSASFGKWHLGGREHYPDRQGFDQWIVTSGRHFAPRFRTTPEVDVSAGTYLADFLTSQAETFIKEHVDEPFFLYLPHYAVHIPLEAEENLIEKYSEKPKPKTGVNHPIYAAMVEHIDRSLGRILDTLDELDLAENTIVVFFSDNGGLYKRFDEQGDAVMSNAPLRAEKGTVYEGGIRVPCIIRWPGVIEPGRSSEPISSVDFFPTFVEVAGLTEESKHRVDGTSLTLLWNGESTLRRDAIYWHFPHYHHMDPAGAIRAGRWKLIEHFDDGELELYDLRDDIGETTNLAESKPEKAAELQRNLATWRKSVGARMPTENPDYDPQRIGEWRRRPRPPR